MTPAGFEKYTDNMVGALNYSIDNMYPKIVNAMSVRTIAALGPSFLTKKKKCCFFFFFYFNRKLDSSKQMTT